MQVIELSHPLKSHYLTILRNENTNSEEFRAYATKLSYLLFIEGTKNISLKEKNITHERTLNLIRAQMIDLSWAGTSEELEKVLLPIRIPLLKGLLGSRVSIIHKRNLAIFENITEEKLQSLVACQGTDWGDSDILEANDYKVLRVARFDLMFKMLNRARCDYFPRAIFGRISGSNNSAPPPGKESSPASFSLDNTSFTEFFVSLEKKKISAAVKALIFNSG